MTTSALSLWPPTRLGGARVTAIAAERPRLILGNADLPTTPASDDAWIRTRTGIETRHVAGEGESIVDLASAATAKALASAGVDAAEVDLLLLASCSLPSQVPGAAPQVAERLGLGGGALDVNAACAGFCYALGLAASALRSGSASTAVVVGAERMTDWLDWDDRGTAILFGDGAGAAVLQSVPAEANGIGPVVWGSDGTGRDLIRVPDFERHLAMDGSAVFRWATSSIAAVAEQACAQAGIAPRDLAAFVPHQANLRIVNAVARQLGLDEATVVADDVRTSGNTSSASVPLALSRLVETGRVAHGEPVLLLAFGAGLSWAAQVVLCP
ncbi:MAG TPA: beta-ketoacyl-ACP synthase 3 [Frankiaceae bacterium]|nr:beta-ketoacyl-ACP synthase 3 [Frankiaceae bacterium]